MGKKLKRYSVFVLGALYTIGVMVASWVVRGSNPSYMATHKGMFETLMVLGILMLLVGLIWFFRLKPKDNEGQKKDADW